MIYNYLSNLRKQYFNGIIAQLLFHIDLDITELIQQRIAKNVHVLMSKDQFSHPTIHWVIVTLIERQKLLSVFQEIYTWVTMAVAVI